MAKSQLEWEIYDIVASYLQVEDVSDDIAHDIMQLLISKGIEN